MCYNYVLTLVLFISLGDGLKSEGLKSVLVLLHCSIFKFQTQHHRSQGQNMSLDFSLVPLRNEVLLLSPLSKMFFFYC